MVFYLGGCAGGVWKTTDGGTYQENVSDGFIRTSAVAAITVAGADHNVIYVGTSESCIRGDVSYGDGAYSCKTLAVGAFALIRPLWVSGGS